MKKSQKTSLSEGKTAPVAKKERAKKVYDPKSNNLIDILITRLELNSDSELARKLKASGPAISKIRHSTVTIGPDFLIKVHEAFGLPISEIRDLIKSSDQSKMLYQPKVYLPKEEVSDEPGK